MKLLEAKGTEAIELMADLIDPISEIAADETLVKCIETKQNIKAMKFGLKNHPKTILQIIALCDIGELTDDYKPTVVEIMQKGLFILNHPDISRLFTMQVQTGEPYSGSATESTEAQKTD